MKNIIKLLSSAFLILALSSCGTAQTEQSMRSYATAETTTTTAITVTEAETSVAENEASETSIETTAETEITTTAQPHEYAEVVHNYYREFYDFIELEEGFFEDISNYENTPIAEEIINDFEAHLKEFDTVHNGITIAKAVTDDFNGNGTEETFIILKCDIEFTNMDYANDSCFALYFISDKGEFTKITVWEKISIDKMYIYPDEKQLVISCINMPRMKKVFAVLAYNGEEVQTVLAITDEAYKDNCFINSGARVSIWNPVQPALWYWNKEDFIYEYVNTNRIPIDDFRNLLKNSVVNNEDEYSTIMEITENCNDVIGIANHIFVLYGEYGENVVTLLEDGSFELTFESLWEGVYADNSNCDIDYFEAIKNMISVE